MTKRELLIELRALENIARNAAYDVAKNDLRGGGLYMAEASRVSAELLTAISKLQAQEQAERRGTA